MGAAFRQWYDAPWPNDAAPVSISISTSVAMAAPANTTDATGTGRGGNPAAYRWIEACPGNDGACGGNTCG
jgi:hypothetical protein